MRVLLCILTGSATLLAAIVVVAWITGRLWSDRHGLGQWLAWIPTPTLLPVVILGLLGSSWPRGKAWFRRIGVRAWLATAAAIAIWFAGFEHRLFRRAADPGDSISFVNWNMTHDAPGPRDGEYIRETLQSLGDVTILASAGAVVGNPEFLAGLPDDIVTATVNRVTILSRLPIIEARLLVTSDSGNVTLLRLLGGPGFDRPLSIFIVDLPSDPRRSRARIARRLRIHLDNIGAPAPDLVLGDFNIPRGSAALARLFAGMRNAYDEGGHGYGASFHRALPLYHIDYALLGENIACPRYDLIDPGVGRHCIQRMYLRPRG